MGRGQYRKDPRVATEKRCPRCGESKPVEEFGRSRSSKDGRQSYCRPCQREVHREWRKAGGNQRRREAYNDPVRGAQVKRYHRNRRFKSVYGITMEEYEAMLERQGGGCAICGATVFTPSGESKLAVDHDHATGRVRGLLCRSCNHGIAELGDTAEGVARALAYLRAE